MNFPTYHSPKAFKEIFADLWGFGVKASQQLLAVIVVVLGHCWLVTGRAYASGPKKLCHFPKCSLPPQVEEETEETS